MMGKGNMRLLGDVISSDKQIDELNYKMKSYLATQKNLELRSSAWKTKQCQDIYVKLLKFAEGFGVVRSGMRGMAKQIAITSYLKNIEPNFEDFKSKVEVANSINYGSHKTKQYKRLDSVAKNKVNSTEGMNIYFIHNGKIGQAEIVKENNRKSGAWCKVKNGAKKKLISYSKMYSTLKDAENALNQKKKQVGIKET